MAMSSWVGSVWSLRGVDGPVIGQVCAVDGEFITLSVVGMGGEALEGAELLPSWEGSGKYVRVSSEILLGKWKRMGNVPA
jgi:hypothetical protein